MKPGWERKKLGELVDVLDNLRKPITKKDRIEGKYPYYGATGILSYVHDYIFSEKLILIGEDGAKWQSGDTTSFIADGKYWVNNHAHVVRPRRDILLDEWIINYLNFSDLTPFITGMTVPKLNQEKMKSIPIPLPPLPEQKRIVAILDEAFTSIAKAKDNAERNLKNAKELFESYLQGVFENKGEDWEEKTLGEVCDFKGGGTPSTKVKKYWDGDIPWVSPKDMKTKFIFDSQDHISMDAIKNSSASIIPSGSILIVVRSGILVRIVPLGITTNELAINQDLKALCPKNKVDLLYLFYFLESNMRLLLSKVSRGATVHRLTTDSLRELSIGIPSLTTQQDTVKKIDALSSESKRLEAIYQSKIKALEELKKSILQKAFNGDLTDRDIAV